MPAAMNPVENMMRLNFHRGLLSDRVCMESYRKALFKTVQKGDVVMDLGTGTGILALFALQAGARRVYAVESGEIIEVAKAVCRRNDFQDRITFLKGHSSRVRLPEKVDLIVSETVGVFGLERGFLPSVLDSRKRFLKRGGRIVPASVELFAVPVESPRVYRKISFWSRGLHGLNFSPVRTFAANTLYQEKLDRGDFLSAPASLMKLDPLKAVAPAVSGKTMFRIRRGGILHGIGGWFSAKLAEGIHLQNTPPVRASGTWGNAFLPVEKPLRVRAGDRVKAKVFWGEDGFTLNWQIDLNGRRFGHSNLFGFPLPA